VIAVSKKKKAERQGSPEVMVRIPPALLRAFRPWSRKQKHATLQEGIRAAMQKACGVK